MIVQGRLASIPPNVQLSKVYYRPALETLRKVREDLSHVSATEVQAWLSDISVEGPGRALDSNRWVQWEFALPNGLSARQAVLGMDRAALVAPHLMGAAKSTAPGVSEYGRGLPNHCRFFSSYVFHVRSAAVLTVASMLTQSFWFQQPLR